MRVLVVEDDALLGDAIQAGLRQQGFVADWLSRLLYYDAPAWVFTLAYSLFGGLVLATWWWFPPLRSRRPGFC